MSKLTHTPGPWTVSYSMVATDHKCICQWQKPIKDQSEEGQANAQLIAAAPELLAALVNIEKHASQAFHNSPALANAIIIARAAIQKAEGVNHE